MKPETQISVKELELISRSMDEDLTELEKRRLNQKILTKSEGSHAWVRYHAVSAVLRKQFPVQLDKKFSDRILQEINKDSRQEEVIEHSVLLRAKSTFKHITGLAVAASVAAVSVMTYQHFSQPTTPNINPIITSEKSFTEPLTSIPNNVQSLPVEFSPAELVEKQQKPMSVPEVEEKIYFRQINPYIQEHSGFGSRRNITPYVEIIELKDVQE